MNQQLHTKVYLEVDFYGLVKSIEPGRSPAIHNEEERYIFWQMPWSPVIRIYNTSFHKLTPRSDTMDCSKTGQVYFWARIDHRFCPALIVCIFQPPNTIEGVKIYRYNGLRIIDQFSDDMVMVTAPDRDLLAYCIPRFLQKHLSMRYLFTSTQKDFCTRD